MPYRATEQTKARRQATEDRIAEAARALVARGGYAGAQVGAVAAEAGVAVGTVYRYFPGKSELLARVFRDASGREVAAVIQAAANAGADAEGRIRAAVETFAWRAMSSGRLAFALLAEPVDPLVEAERLVFRRAYRDAFAAVISQGINRGELPEQDAELSAAALVGAIGEALVGPVSPTAEQPGQADTEQLISSITDFCLRSITGKEPIHVDR